jgi:DHA2 family multidrug resistance protein
MMPIVGFMTSKIDNRKLMMIGIILSGVASLMLGNINLEMDRNSFALSNLLQGAGLALTFVPLALTAMGRLRNDQMGNATGLFSLMRNLGGSLGISIATSMIARGSQAHQATLVRYLTPYDAAYQSKLHAMQSAFAAQAGTVQAQSMAAGSIYNSLLQQSGLLAYVDDFRWLALLSFISIPVVLCLKRVTKHGPIAAH